MADLEKFLGARFDPNMAAEFDGAIRVLVEDQALDFAIREGKLTFDSSIEPDATFIFSDIDTAKTMLTGSGDAIEAFMEGRFKADGYLMWAFAMMAFFRSEPPPSKPCG